MGKMLTLAMSVNAAVMAAPNRYPTDNLVMSSASGGRQQLSPSLSLLSEFTSFNTSRLKSWKSLLGGHSNVLAPIIRTF